MDKKLFTSLLLLSLIISLSVAVLACEDDSDCDEGEYCDNGDCIADDEPEEEPDCVDDSDCAEGEYCDEGECLPDEEEEEANETEELLDCEDDGDCDEGEYCDEGECLPDEEEEESEEESDEPEEEPDCENDEDCDDWELCEDGECVLEEEPKEETEVVVEEEPQEVIVEEPPEEFICQNDEDCDDDELCEDGECVEIELEEVEALLYDDEFFIRKGSPFLVDAYDSDFDEDLDSIVWDFGDGVIMNGSEVQHIYNTSGVYTLTLRIFNEDYESSTTARVVVYKSLMTLVVDGKTSETELNQIENLALSYGIMLESISLPVNYFQSDYLAREIYAKKLAEHEDAIISSSKIIIKTDGFSGLIALSQFSRDQEINLKSKQIFFLSDHISDSLAKVASYIAPILDAKDLVLTSNSNLAAIFALGESKDLEKLGSKYTVLDSEANESPFNIASSFIGYLAFSGISLNTLILLLMLPVAATIVVFFRQIIGIQTFGVFAPSLIAISLLATGLWYGLLIFFVLLGLGAFLRYQLKNLKLLGASKISVVLIFVTILMLLLLWAGLTFGVSEIISVTTFPMLIMAFMIERFVSVESERGIKEAITLVSGTLALSVICYFVMSWNLLQMFMLAYPSVIVALFVLNVFFGRWTGMTLFEYRRFKQLR